MKNVTTDFPALMKHCLKHFVTELKDRDDFDVRASERKCVICSKMTTVPEYRFYEKKEWTPAINEQSINCKSCTDQKELAKVLKANHISTKEYLSKRFEKQYWEIPDDLKHAGFKNFLVDSNSNVFEAKRTSIEYVKKFTEIEPERRYNLLIMGNPGTGKTHLVTAIARTLRKKGFLVGFITTGKLLGKIQSTFNKGSSYTKEDIYKDIKRFDLLILDDLGSEAKSKDEFDWSKKELFEIVNLRIRKPTIYTTNYNEKHLPTAIGERVYSRLYNNTKFIKLVTDDYRKKFLIK
ncbi:ATP-binding protein [Oceanobacillus halophilus]|uniref:AAA family ATPase n=1 Tax=Oceanobacillus halophilus TaxID=930130 RepID=A0A494ZZH8_9BACI|nr:ATP-binding protein [Oceanobacillus halophilus]RKQ32307.1 AAA family ATPase [Oceanobacillus halophilus]